MNVPSIDTAAAAFVAVALLAIFIERALALLFEHQLWITYVDKRWSWAKEFLCFAVCYIVVRRLNFDAVAMTAGHPDPHTLGKVLTAAALAGGSKGSKKLFYDFLDIKSNAARAQQVVQTAEVATVARAAEVKLEHQVEAEPMTELPPLPPSQ